MQPGRWRERRRHRRAYVIRRRHRRAYVMRHRRRYLRRRR
jgi:hypothetical protein